MTDERRAELFGRLRRTPSPSTVPGTLPVLFFGDLFRAQVASVGLNASDQEYLTKTGQMLTGRAQRFATLDSLGASDRVTLLDSQCDEAVERMRAYYDEGKPVYGSWFNALSRVVVGFGAGFRERSAVHSISCRSRRARSGASCRSRRKRPYSSRTCPSSSGRSAPSRFEL